MSTISQVFRQVPFNTLSACETYDKRLNGDWIESSLFTSQARRLGMGVEKSVFVAMRDRSAECFEEWWGRGASRGPQFLTYYIGRTLQNATFYISPHTIQRFGAKSTQSSMFAPLRDNEIRILSIPPAAAVGQENTRIECDIIVASLNDPTNQIEYETLSYVWGSDAVSVTIFVSGQPVEISKPLYNALRRLQLSDRPRLIWIDQLCIDQKNIEEKTKQVQLMSAIYTKCARCIAWLGEVRDDVPFNDAETALQLLQYLNAVAHAANPDDIPFPPAVQANFGATIKALRTIAPNENMYWNRIWTVQEAALPKDVSFQWGPLEIPWNLLESAQAVWTRNTPRQLTDLAWHERAGEDVFNSLISHFVWLSIAKSRFEDIFGMIQHYRVRRATDPRDKIYGLLGLCYPGRIPLTEKCDYSIPPADVFTTLTQELIISWQSLRPITNTPRQLASQATPGMPSWALDLAHSTVGYSPDVFYLLHGYHSYNAADGLDPIDVEPIKAQLGEKKLTLKGVCVGTIARLQRGLKTNSGDSSQIFTTERLLQEWYNTAIGCAFQPDHEQEGSAASELYPKSTYKRSEAFARLVLGDLIRNHQQVPARTIVDADIQDIWKIVGGHANDVNYDTRRTVYGMMVNQHMFVTENGLFGCGHMDSQIGDEVWVFRGGNVPFTIRRRDGEDGYSFVGQCFVQGVMRAEVSTNEEFVEKTATLY